MRRNLKLSEAILVHGRTPFLNPNKWPSRNFIGESDSQTHRHTHKESKTDVDTEMEKGNVLNIHAIQYKMS